MSLAQAISTFKNKRGRQLALLFSAILLLMGAGDSAARFDSLGHKMICACGCKQILLECNHVGCSYSSGLRDELSTALGRGDSDDLVLQAFVQKYGNTVLAAPTATGFNRIAWLMPFLVFLLGTIGAGYVIKKWKLRESNVPAAVGHRPPELQAFRQRARKETEL